MADRPRIDVVGLGPAGPDLMTAGTLDLVKGAPLVLLRTRRHPAASVPELDGAGSFDHVYEDAPNFDDVYGTVVCALVEAARTHGRIVYAVPGSPTVAERTVVLLRDATEVKAGDVKVDVHPAVSFADLAFARLGVDPMASGVRVVDAATFAADAAGVEGPMLVAQCWSRALLSDVKLAADPVPGTTVTVLHHLGLGDEAVFEVDWDALDRDVDPDHLTSLWIGGLAAPVAAELVRLDDLVRVLRERCPWDREQTHGSLARHLLEEAFETLEAVDAIAAVDARRGGAVTSVDDVERGAVAHLEEELGDLLFQVFFHAALAAEAGRFTMADVARGIHDKLVARHPHVFGATEATTPDQVAANWEALKKAEKGRRSVTEGIPAALPALAVAAKLQRKARTVGMVEPDPAERSAALAVEVGRLGARVAGGDGRADGDGEGAPVALAAEVGEILFGVVDLARRLGVDAEGALRVRAAAFRGAIEATESVAVPPAADTSTRRRP